MWGKSSAEPIYVGTLMDPRGIPEQSAAASLELQRGKAAPQGSAAARGGQRYPISLTTYIDLHSDELDALLLERPVPRQKGNWWLIPKDVADY